MYSADPAVWPCAAATIRAEWHLPCNTLTAQSVLSAWAQQLRTMIGASGGSSADFAFQGAVLSHNGSLILAPCGSALRLFSAVTGGQVGVLEGHEDNISCVAINAKSSTQVRDAHSCHRGGTCGPRSWQESAQSSGKGFHARPQSTLAMHAATLLCCSLPSSISHRAAVGGREWPAYQSCSG